MAKKAKAVDSRSKGKVGEREAANYLRKLGFTDARRREQSDGSIQAEVECPFLLPSIHIEVKYGYKTGFDVGTSLFNQACLQAMADAKDLEPVVMWRKWGETIWKLTYISANGIGWSTVSDDGIVAKTLQWLQDGSDTSRERESNADLNKEGRGIVEYPVSRRDDSQGQVPEEEAERP